MPTPPEASHALRDWSEWREEINWSPTHLRHRSPIAVKVGATLSEKVRCFDTDTHRHGKDKVKLSASGLPAGAKLAVAGDDTDSPVGTFTFKPEAAQVGRHTIAFQAKDQHGKTAGSSLIVVVRPEGFVNRAPKIVEVRAVQLRADASEIRRTERVNPPGHQIDVRRGDRVRIKVGAADLDEEQDYLSISCTPLGGAPAGPFVCSPGNPATAWLDVLIPAAGPTPLQYDFVVTDVDGLKDQITFTLRVP